MAVPYTFGTATSSIPLSQLDSNFNTVITLGNTAIQLGNTVTTLNNMTLANVTISSGNVTITNVTITTANVTTANIGTAFVSGNVSFTGTGNRITGDFSNATVASRALLQSSTGTFTDIGALAPSSSTQSSAWTAYLGNDPTNTSRTRMLATSVDGRFESGITGTGTYLPMTFYTGGSERMRLDTSGNVGIGTNSPAYKLDVNGGIRMPNATVFWINNAAGTAQETLQLYSDNNTYLSTPGALVFRSNGTVERMRIDSSGNVLVTNPAGLGYGTGSGGTVTQATSRTTAVTINKPTGKITMFTATGSPTWSNFTVNNSLFTTTDTVVLTVEGGNANTYMLTIVGTAAGSFIIGFATTGGVASDTPRINFAIIKGATS